MNNITTVVIKQFCTTPKNKTEQSDMSETEVGIRYER